MRTTKYILGMILTAAVLLGGCKYDDTELWDALNGQGARIAALEQWQTTVNSNISTLQGLVSALESNDYVTGVTPFANPEPGGYTITFVRNAPITLYHGTNGTDGTHGKDGSTPVIGVEEYPSGSGVYYWTMDGEWLTSGGKKMAVTGEKGADGATPKLAIGSDGYWYISATGTATGKAPGAGWVSTGVKASGESGSSGSGLFSSVDNSHPDYVAFTLTNGTIINLPKHRTIGIRFDAPGVFMANGESQVIPYTIIGDVEPSAIWVVDVPASWKISIDTKARTITITSPASFSYDAERCQPTLLVADGDRVTAMYRIVLKIINQNVLGGTYYENYVQKGIVYIPSKDPEGGDGRILYLDEAKLDWATEDYKYLQTGCNSHTSGRDNMASMAQFIAENDQSWSNFPAFEWIHALNGTNTHYTSDATGIWYMPSLAELEYLLCVAAGEGLETWGYSGADNYPSDSPSFNPDVNNKLDLSVFNSELVGEGVTPLRQAANTRYQSSREFAIGGGYGSVWNLDFYNGECYNNTSKNDKNIHLYTRAILAF